MEIRCKATKRFLGIIEIEEYYKQIKNMGLDITIPLKVKFPCPKCKMVEEYEIYPTHYVHTGSYKHNLTKK